MTNDPQRAQLQRQSDSPPYLVPHGLRDRQHKPRDTRRADCLSGEDGLKWGITPDGLFRLRQMP